MRILGKVEEEEGVCFRPRVSERGSRKWESRDVYGCMYIHPTETQQTQLGVSHIYISYTTHRT